MKTTQMEGTHPTYKKNDLQSALKPLAQIYAIRMIFMIAYSNMYEYKKMSNENRTFEENCGVYMRQAYKFEIHS